MLAKRVSGSTVRAELAAECSEWLIFVDGHGGSAEGGEVNMERVLLSWLRDEVPGSRAWGKPRLMQAFRSATRSSNTIEGKTAAFRQGEKVRAQWLIKDPHVNGQNIVDPEHPDWYGAEVRGRGPAQKSGPTFRLHFDDGWDHPGVPACHIRRVRK